MKLRINILLRRFAFPVCMVSCLFLFQAILFAQDSTAVAEATEETKPAKPRPVKNTFQSIWIIDNQTVMVPVKGTLEMDIQHRFGTIEKGYEDLWGLFASSNIRLGVSYAPSNRLNVGLGVTRSTAAVKAEQAPGTVIGPVWDGSLKYSIITQTKNRYPVSATYYTNVAYNTMKDPEHNIYRDEEVLGFQTDRFTFFHQLIIARKITDKLSIQVAPSVSHHNLVDGYFVQLNDSTLKVKQKMKFDHFAVAVSARYKLTNVTSVMINYDQPLTKHVNYNPDPNLSFGLEFNTSSHSFQLFITNYQFLIPQINNLYNRNSPFGYTDKAENRKVDGGKFLIGFNITRLWNY